MQKCVKQVFHIFQSPRKTLESIQEKSHRYKWRFFMGVSLLIAILSNLLNAFRDVSLFSMLLWNIAVYMGAVLFFHVILYYAWRAVKWKASYIDLALCSSISWIIVLPFMLIATLREALAFSGYIDPNSWVFILPIALLALVFWVWAMYAYLMTIKDTQHFTLLKSLIYIVLSTIITWSIVLFVWVTALAIFLLINGFS